MGSPIVSLWKCVREWQPPMTCYKKKGHKSQLAYHHCIECTFLLSSFTGRKKTIDTLWVSSGNTLQDEMLVGKCARFIKAANIDLHFRIKAMKINFTLPANGIRKGSVQNIPSFCSCKREVFTAKLNSVGSSNIIR